MSRDAHWPFFSLFNASSVLSQATPCMSCHMPFSKVPPPEGKKALKKHKECTPWLTDHSLHRVVFDMENAEEGQFCARSTFHLSCKTPNSSARRESRLRKGFLLTTPNQNCTVTLTSSDPVIFFSPVLTLLQPAAFYPPPRLIKPPVWLVACYQPEKENLTPQTLHQTFLAYFSYSISPISCYSVSPLCL